MTQIDWRHIYAVYAAAFEDPSRANDKAPAGWTVAEAAATELGAADAKYGFPKRVDAAVRIFVKGKLEAETRRLEEKSAQDEYDRRASELSEIIDATLGELDDEPLFSEQETSADRPVSTARRLDSSPSSSPFVSTIPSRVDPQGGEWLAGKVAELLKSKALRGDLAEELHAMITNATVGPKPRNEETVYKRLLGYQELVDEFHFHFDHPRPQNPTLAEARTELRIALIREELEEFAEAARGGDLVGVADALGDLLYVVFGAAVEYGTDMWPVFTEIHRSNMDKLHSDGTHRKREDGKTLKPDGWTPPNIRGELEKQGWAADTERTVSVRVGKESSALNPFTASEEERAAERRALIQGELALNEQQLTELLQLPTSDLSNLERLAEDRAETRRLREGFDVPVPKTPPDVLAEIQHEFVRAGRLWGGNKADDEKSLQQFADWIERYASWASMRATNHDWPACRESLLKAGALCLSAVNSLDRRYPNAKSDATLGTGDLSRRLRDVLKAIDSWREKGQTEPYYLIERIRRTLNGEQF